MKVSGYKVVKTNFQQF